MPVSIIPNYPDYFFFSPQPLHLAIKNNSKNIVESIVDFTKTGLLIRNLDGFIPLHLSIHEGLEEITNIIIDASPTEVLHMENGVGETPIEMAQLRAQKAWIAEYRFWAEAQNFPQLNTEPNHDSSRGSRPRSAVLARQKIEVPKLRTTINNLLRNGGLIQGSTLADALGAFADRMEAKLKEEEQEEQTRIDDKSADNGMGCHTTPARKAVSQLLKKAVSARPAPRSLVRVIDVQRSVQGILDRNKNAAQEGVTSVNDDSLEKAKDTGDRERRGSLVLASERLFWRYPFIYNDMSLLGNAT